MARIRNIDWECWRGAGWMLPIQFVQLVFVQTIVESPIEMALGAELIAVFSEFVDFAVCEQGGQGDFEEARLFLIPQYQWRDYRIDWALCCDKRRVFVECDEHEFHERTKAQAEHDRARDRKIQAAGIGILRFTGREITRDAKQCAREVLEFCRGRL